MNEASASSITVSGMRQGTQSYCYASLRLLHTYIELCCVVEEDDYLTAAAPTAVAQARSNVNVARKMKPIVVSSSSDSDEYDEDGDDEDSDDEASDEDDESDDDDDDDSEEDDDDFDRPDPKEIVRRLIPDFYTALLRNLTKLLTTNDDSILVYAWACLEALLKVCSLSFSVRSMLIRVVE